MTPTISVIIAVFNGEKYLTETLQSLSSQHYPALEIVLVDDGSTDNTAAIAQGHGPALRYIYQPNQGQPTAFNRGIAEASGEFIGVADADDLWAQDKLQLQLPALLQGDRKEMSLGMIQRFWTDSDGTRQFLPPERAMSFLASLIHRDLFKAIGPLDTGLASHYDIDWFMRAREAGVDIHNHDDVVGYYRRHGENMSTTTDEAVANSAMLTMLRRSLDRRRERESNKKDTP